ncbi:uncharacterized protein LOC123319864 [Coccinella septempunctata]|uniref:uncharacterized protein LOC123319864 n=1 Tax=Coccinella septempunctata TaxID=41139 RepID=UPI001D095B43|nr:uncharacterized protein LOC123319864 [Coccinella septempunctata]XP_044762828.1 uncharacterized protein LOC123319864 [Coccinella septempunctata]
MLFLINVISWVWIAVLISSKCVAILTGNSQSYEDITSLPKYGCHWTGGSNSMVNCTCREDAEEFSIHHGQIPVYDTWGIQINDCKKVIFDGHSIENLRNLRQIHLKNIPSLSLLPESFSWFGYRATYESDDEADDENNIPSLSISMDNCVIEKISQHSFKGRIKDIELNNCHVKDMESFSFSSLRQSGTVVLRNTTIDSLKPQAFKLFTTKQLILDGISIEDVPSRAFSNLVIKEKLQISNCRFGTLHSGSFMIDGPKWFEVVNSNISVLEGEAFTVKVKGDVLFKNNVIGVLGPGALMKIVKSKDLVLNTALFLTIDSNVFSYLWSNSLEVNGLIAKFVNLQFNESCNCDIFMSNYALYKEFFTEIKCLDAEEYISIKDYEVQKCTMLSGHTTMIVVIGVICALLLVMIIILSLYYHKVFKEGKYGKDNAPQKNVSLIVPDGRTYRETEVHVILETADLLTTDL